MAIEFTWLDKESIDSKLILENDTYYTLCKAFDELEKLTGIYVDPYSDTRLSPENASLLLNYIKKNINSKNDKIGELERMLMISIENSRWILVLGD